MKKRLYFAALLLAAAFRLTACSGRDGNISTAAYIGIEAAKEAALQSAGILPEQALFSSASLDSRDGIAFYQINFSVDGTEYEYAIDALTGIVIQDSRLAKQPPISSEAPLSQAESRPSSPEIENQANLENGGGSGSSDESGPPGPSRTAAALPAQPDSASVSFDAGRAEDIALAHAGVSRSSVKGILTKGDSDGTISLYEVNFYTDGGVKYEYEIDAATGKVIKFDREEPDDDEEEDEDIEEDRDSGNPGADGSRSVIGEAAAGQIALARVPGAGGGDVSLSLEEDDGRMEYKGKVIYDGMEYEFKIDAYSGALVEWEAEPED